jgi:hypothetical protein
MPFESPPGRGKGRQALGWVVPNGSTHPGASRPREVFSRLHLRVTAPNEISLGVVAWLSLTACTGKAPLPRWYPEALERAFECRVP